VSNCDGFVLQFRPKLYLLFTSTRLSLNQISLGLLSITLSNAGSFQLKLYFYKEFLIMKGATASHRKCGCIMNKISVKHCVLKIAFLELSS